LSGEQNPNVICTDEAQYTKRVQITWNDWLRRSY